MPPAKLRAFVEAFRTLKQKVLWKYENESIPNLPDNVMVRKWMPQSDILAHKNVVLFVSHGGVFGKQEGVHRGVPMLFIPLYADQVNAYCIRNASYILHTKNIQLTDSSSIVPQRTTRRRRWIRIAAAIYRCDRVDTEGETSHDSRQSKISPASERGVSAVPRQSNGPNGGVHVLD